ncbi:hypothetical protein PROFUN_11167 [Planoprotostelium fungivorum]|uniref:Uncharacterized protein n=1 Tax=Planoprotostelium fungivorum TaxID=1890364 RepID=A0A2P6NAM9_9EUKA|nr:hypothetical protein PROFUN_11167 [Planoprotostelium fungivorum]
MLAAGQCIDTPHHSQTIAEEVPSLPAIFRLYLDFAEKHKYVRTREHVISRHVEDATGKPIDCALVWINCPSEDDVVDKLVNEPLTSGLCGAVNRLRGVESSFFFQGSIEKSEECILIYKTRVTLVKPLIKYITNNHPYSDPEVFSIKLDAASKSFYETMRLHTRNR